MYVCRGVCVLVLFVGVCAWIGVLARLTQKATGQRQHIRNVHPPTHIQIYAPKISSCISAESGVTPDTMVGATQRALTSTSPPTSICVLFCFVDDFIMLVGR